MDNGDLYKAAETGDVDLVRAAILTGVDVNYMDLEMRYGWSDSQAIEVAAQYGHLGVVRELLAAGATNRIFGRDAIVSGSVDVVREWLAVIPEAANQFFDGWKRRSCLPPLAKR